jgi:hypothetical protein
MAEAQKFKQTKKRKPKKEDEGPTPTDGLSSEKKKKLEVLDEFIEGVLQEAGEEFLEEFKQVEGQ